MPSAPQEYTPEITEEFYNKLSRPIQQRTAERAGAKRGEALARGLAGDPWEASAVGGAEAEGDQQLSDLYSKLNYDVAGLQRDERLTGEDRAFRRAEAHDARAFQEKMARLGYQESQAQWGREKNLGWQKLPFELAAGGGAAAAMYFSDRRLKQNVRPMGKSGRFNIYAFEYKPGLGLPEGEQVGVMADEVEKIMPAAVVEIAGYKAVNYAMLGVL